MKARCLLNQHLLSNPLTASEKIQNIQLSDPPSLTTIAMAQKYAKDEPAGFTNRIERVALVGVSLPQHLYSPTFPDTTIRPAAAWGNT